FRPFVYRLAGEMQLPGWVTNSAQGVFIEVEGSAARLHEFVLRIEREKPAVASIQSLEATYLDPSGFTGFEIRESQGGEKTATILPDLSTCADCQLEMNNPADRRYRYPFTNCTNCGPRFTIIESLPYDRPRTTMKKFTMCAECSHEYHDPRNRRFHAQPNACPACGPRLELWDRTGALLAGHDDALLACAAAIREGRIVAVKGLGGFHLIVNAASEPAVLELRRRKRRNEKPFALMFPSLESVRAVCGISAVEERMLCSVESPIVLLRRVRGPGEIAPSVAPRNPCLGAMLPYTPLHHLLLQELRSPVVATSGNLSEEPICIDEQDALQRLAGIADVFLVHDRPIARHVDDSVAREMAGRELVLRRARGFAPLPVTVARELPPLLAVGAHQKNSIAVSVGTQVFISQHIGDLETEASSAAFRSVIAALERMYELEPVAIACDLHPDYVSTRYALAAGRRVVPIQHHHAHVLSCMAENHLQPPVLGISWDGSGYGPDHTVWGGEVLAVDGPGWGCGFRRVAHLRTFRLPGGEKAVREPRRVALALLFEIFGENAFEMDCAPLRAFSPAELRVLKGMLKNQVNSPVSSSAGRLFDGVASLCGLRQVCRFEGQAAMELEFAGSEAPRLAEEACYPYAIREPERAPLVLDWEPMVKAILAETGTVEYLALKFHNSLAAMVSEVAAKTRYHRVALTGGCFQNRYLTESCIRRLKAAGHSVYWHQRVPPNDGGIALGQIVGAAAVR
ncbi:MAG: carbamoyltransferase HypF, partial [Acidobacteria bacterium]|nr:carbamoyltransferase HypF [Acidobacteriota bacterium]